MELDPALDEAFQLREYVRNARIVQENLAGVPRSRVNRDVQRRESVLEDALEIPLLEVRERGEVAVREREPVIVVADVEGLPEPFRQALDKAELAAIGAAANRGRLEVDPHRFALGALDVVHDLLPIREARVYDEF